MSEKKTAVIAIGGNSLIKDNAHQRIEDQYLAARETTFHIANMIENGWNVAIGHGNGPQVGLILRQSEVAARAEGIPETPLDVCGAQSEGLIGYLLQQNLQNELYSRGIKQNVATIITQVLVDANDPAFSNPTKPIGGFMSEAEAHQKARELGWSVVEDAGRGWRRVVASPIPQEVVELDTVKTLIHAGVIVITVGGGGIPVINPGDGNYVGAPAVIDKDYASSLLAQAIHADLFVISTAVEQVALNYGKPNEQPISRMTSAQAQQYIEEGHFAKGSMLPKIRAILRYLEKGGPAALITTPESIGRALEGKTGTWVVP
jgi:carbamate kinase